jgi:hypothetical protein
MFGTDVDEFSLVHEREHPVQGIVAPYISKLEEHSPEITWLQHPGLLPHTPENVVAKCLHPGIGRRQLGRAN